MVKLTCLDFASQWEYVEVSKYPEIGMFVEKLKRLIKENPEKGRPDPILYKGRELRCLKRSVKLELIPRHNAMGFSFITAWYVYDGDNVFIINMDYL